MFADHDAGYEHRADTQFATTDRLGRVERLERLVIVTGHSSTRVVRIRWMIERMRVTGFGGWTEKWKEYGRVLQSLSRCRRRVTSARSR